MLTLEDCLTSSGKYPERAKHKECTDQVKDNALELQTRVNACLYDLGIKNAKVGSGFRPSDVNKGTPGASANSHHMRGDAEDLEGQIIGKMLQADYEKQKKNGTPEKSLLVKHDLYLEHPDYTLSWSHLQKVPPKSGNRVFIPYAGKKPKPKPKLPKIVG